MNGTVTVRGEAFAGTALAIFFSVNTVFIVIFSAVGISGNSTFSGAFLITCEAVILICSMSPIRLGVIDYLFGLFVLAAAISSALNGLTAGPKETAIFLVSVAGYPICRFISATERLRTAFGAASLFIAVIGSIATAHAIVEQWPVDDGKPVVFGNDAAGAHFLMALAFFVITVISFQLTRAQRLLTFALLFVLSIVFAAALVRFTFVALLLALGLAFLLTSRKQRAHIAVIAASIVLGATCGTLVRFDKIPILIGFMTEKMAYRSAAAPQPAPLPASSPTTAPPPQVAKTFEPERQVTAPVPVQAPPSCLMEVNMRNSFAERKALWQDSFYLIPRSGMFGFGLDGFMKYTCMKGFPPHNSVFQAFIEFGWFGGAGLSAMIVLAFLRLGPTAKFSKADRFIVCLLAFVVLISLAHGRLSRDFVLFSVLGITAARIYPEKGWIKASLEGQPSHLRSSETLPCAILTKRS